jgi:predicted nucleic acid-binding protein
VADETNEVEGALDDIVEDAEQLTPAILDAGAVLAYLQAEPGGEVIRQLIEGSDRPLYIHALNATEVYYHFARTDTPGIISVSAGQAVVATMEADSIEVRGDLDRIFWEDAAQLKAIWRRVSLADCCGVALARRLGGEFFTTDRHELTALQSGNVTNITFIR